MSEVMQVLFDNLADKWVQKFLPTGSDRLWSRPLEDRETALVETLTDRQKVLWEQYQSAQIDYALQYERALFQAAFALSRELR